MSTINVNDLKDRLQSTIDNINNSIRSNNFGTDTIDKLSKQKTILSNQINDISSKSVVNEEDEKNTTRLIAIAETKQLFSEPKGKSGNGIFIGILVVFTLAGIYYYYKNKE
jgi:CHASE3 domain sensor protein